ncbi:MAG: hypothetical protein ACYDB7_07360 [Mycobacteriales bacterium]
MGRTDFLYVADSKLCSTEAMRHIAAQGGRFVTIIPHGRREDTWFRNWAQTHAPTWTEAKRLPGARQDDSDRVWRTFEAPLPSTDGYRVIWVHSTVKAARDAATRAARIEAGLAAIDALGVRLASPKSRLKTTVGIEQAASAALAEAGAGRWVGFRVTATAAVKHRQESRGRPGPATRYRRLEKTVFTITAQVRADKVAYDAVTDGCFPTITNDKELGPAEVLAAYLYQPNLVMWTSGVSTRSVSHRNCSSGKSRCLIPARPSPVPPLAWSSPSCGPGCEPRVSPGRVAA